MFMAPVLRRCPGQFLEIVAPGLQQDLESKELEVLSGTPWHHWWNVSWASCKIPMVFMVFTDSNWIQTESRDCNRKEGTRRSSTAKCLRRCCRRFFFTGFAPGFSSNG